MNILFVKTLEQISGDVKFIKDSMTKKRTMSVKTTDNMHHCSAIASHSLLEKKEDLGAFMISCNIASFIFCMGLR